MRKTFFFILAVVICCLLIPSRHGHAGKTLDIAVIDGNYPPYYYFEGVAVKGLAVEIAKAVFKEMGQEVNLRPVPWKRAMASAQSATLDGLLSIYKTPERTTYLHFPPESLYTEAMYLFTRKGTGIRNARNPHELSHLKVSVVENYYYGPTFENMAFTARHAYGNDHKMTKMVLKGRYPLGIGNYNVVRFHAKVLRKLQDLVILQPSVYEAPSYIAFSYAPGHKELSNSFSLHLKSFKQTQAYKDIMQKYGVKP